MQVERRVYKDFFGIIYKPLSGGWVSNAWGTCLLQGDSLGKPGIIPYDTFDSHELKVKAI